MSERTEVRLMFIITITLLLTVAIVDSPIIRDVKTPIVIRDTTPCNPREYQIDLELDSIWVWDNGRLVGKVINGNSPIDTLFWKDNE